MRILAVVLLLVSLTATAFAQDMSPVLDRLERLERDTQNLQLEVFRGEGKAPENLGSAGLNRLEGRISALEQSLRQMTGSIEELQYQFQQQQTRSDKAQSDLELRLQMIEQRLQALQQPQPQPAAQPAATEATAAEPTIAEAQPPLDPKAAYDAALTHIRQGEYEVAESALRSFIKQFPTDALAGNAQYWLGETLYVRGLFEPASVEFVNSYKNYPKSPKAPDSLLKLGLSLARLKKTQQACASFAQLQKQFPKADANIINRAQAERQKLACGKTG